MSTGSNNYLVHSLLRARDWQHRSQLGEVCSWWRDGGRGVCALIGMGGAGKTAVTERFLRILPGGLPEDPGIPKDDTLRAPHSTFVFSFYDAHNVEEFFEALQRWLQNTAQLESVLSFSAMGFLLQQRQGLIVLDGLERVQSDGQRGDFGRLISPRLRDFLNQLASGMFRDLSVLVTSRFPLADLRDRHPHFFRSIPVNQIDIATGVQLLKDRGVRGTDPQLEQIVEQCGRHALTVDFAGGYIAEYGTGDPMTALNLGTVGELREASERDELDEDQRQVLRQGYRFARIAEHYRDAMLQRDEAAMALLERICLFRLGVDGKTLASIFTGDQAVQVSGQALAELDTKQLQSKLDWLVRMRIVEVSEAPMDVSGKVLAAGDRALDASTNRRLAPGRSVYSIHPAVRDGFLSGISRDAAVAGHEAVRKGLEVSLGKSPGKNPSDPATLDLLEEIVHHTLQSGHVLEAWDVYWNRIGNHMNLIWRLGAYERGERICRAFAGGQTPESVVSQYHESKPEAKAIGPSRDADPSLALQVLGNESSDTPREGLRPSAKTSAPFLDLPEAKQLIFFNQWALYLKGLGRLAAAAPCNELYIEMEMQREDWKEASVGNQNLCEVWLLCGHVSRLPPDEQIGRTERSKPRRDDHDPALPGFAALSPAYDSSPSEASAATGARHGASSAGALAIADEALRLAELADDAGKRLRGYSWAASFAQRATAKALCGAIGAALEDFDSALCKQKLDENKACLYSTRGFRKIELLARLGRREEASRLTDANQQICWRVFGSGADNRDVPKCQLVFSSLSIEQSVYPSSNAECSAALWTQARDWALARDAKELLCWSFLVEAQHALVHAQCERQGASRRSDEQPQHAEPAASALPLTQAHTALESGLKIARDCGFGLYHIDLLLQRARLHLLRGDVSAALDDIEMALGDEADAGGIPANEETGQPELLAALHPACGYAWPVPFGLQLKAEALLLQAAREVISEGWALPTKEGRLNPINVDAAASAHPAIGKLVDEAKQLLQESLDLWQPLHDPEPEREDQNFQLNGRQYNYKAADTHSILSALQQGILTRYPLSPVETDSSETTPQKATREEALPKRFRVALSFPGEHREFVQGVAASLSASLGSQNVLYDKYYEAEFARTDLDTYLQTLYRDESELIVVFLCSDYEQKRWCKLEWRAIRDLIATKDSDSIMPVRFDRTEVSGLFVGDGYVEVNNRSSAAIADLILQRLSLRTTAIPE